MLNKAFWEGRRVFLTGHTGFKGAWLALWLRELGAEVTGFALPPEGRTLWGSLSQPCNSILGDIRDRDHVNRELVSAQPEIVLHLAAQALVQDSYRDPVATFETNVLGCIHVFEAARRCESVRAILNVTSDKCYENTEQIWSYREGDPMGGADPYSASKGCAELVTAAWRRSYFSEDGGAVIASARAGNVIGGGDWSANRLLPDAVRAFDSRSPLLIRNPLAIRPWQHVLEPLSGYLMLAERLHTSGKTFAEGWNFGPSDQDTWNVGEVATLAARLWGGGAQWCLDEASHPHEAHSLKVDPTKAQVRLGWRPRLDVASSVEWTVEWYQRAGLESPETLARDQISKYRMLPQLGTVSPANFDAT